MAVSITVRRLDPVTGEPMYGLGQANFISDIDAVAQIILTTIRLFEGEWWEALDQGTPMFQRIIGATGVGSNPQTVSLILQQRILGAAKPFVLGIPAITTIWDSIARSFSFACSVDTVFGNLVLSTAPGSSAIIGNS